MLSEADYNQLKLFYSRFKKMNSHIKELIELDKYEDVDFAIQEKEKLMRQIISFEKPRLKDIKTNPELDSMRIELIELERANIETIKLKRQKAISKLSNLKRTKKVIKAYEPSLSNINSTIDIMDQE